jgi:hypothetical protein
MPRVRAAVIALALASAPAAVRAQAPQPPRAPPVSPDRATLAETLFEKAKALMAEHHYDEACPMLAESQQLDPGGGTLLTLALCHERQGRTATAWTELKDALARAQQEGEADRAAVARQHLEALEPRLSRLVIRVDVGHAFTPGLAIARDGIVLGRPAWGLPVPVDPGEHTVEAVPVTSARATF